MKPLTHSLRFCVLAAACVFSGITINANTGRGFILLALPLVVMLTLVHLSSSGQYRSRWLVGAVGLLLLCAANGSRPGSVLLMLLGLVLFEALRSNYRGRAITRIDLRWLVGVGGLMILLALVDLVTGTTMRLWTGYAAHETPLINVPRLKLFFSEPSYLGVFCAAVFFRLHGHPGLRWFMLLVICLTHSLFAAIYFLVLLLRRKTRLLAVLSCVALAGVIAIAQADVDLFFVSSGLIRLVGITQLSNMDGLSLWLGHGLGAGDSALETLFNGYGIETANGFLFSLVYDVGLLGMLCLYLAYTRSFFDLVHFNLLLLNFGIGSFLLPVLLFMNTAAVRPRKSLNLTVPGGSAP